MLTQSFEIENVKTERGNKIRATIITVVVHALIIFALFWMVISLPDPPFEDFGGGMAVNFGTSDVGSGDVQPTTLVPIEVSNSTPPPTSQAAASENIETQDLEDAPALETQKEKPKKQEKKNDDALFKPTKTTTSQSQPTPEKPTVNSDALFNKGAKGNPNNSKGDGEGGGKGDQGKENGDPNATSYKGDGGSGGGTGGGNGPGNGPGSGNGTQWKLKDRKPTRRYQEAARCSEKGKVSITIKVNKQGQVISAQYSLSGSTTSDDCLVNHAKQMATQWLFDVKEDAPDVQVGNILFKFGER